MTGHHRFVLYAGIISLFLFHCGKPDMQYRIKKGAFQSTLSETGEVQAVESRVVVMPYIGWKYGNTFKIIELAEHGKEVSAGDTIAQIDPQSVLRMLMEKTNQLEVEKAALNKLLVGHQSKRESLSAELEAAEATLNLNKIQLEKLKFGSERQQKIQKLEYQQASIIYEKSLKKLELTEKIMSCETAIQETKLAQLKNEIEDSERALSELVVTSPLSGMIQLAENWQTRTTVRVGDELYQGRNILSVPDLKKMKVNATVNEAEIGKIHLNQNVTVRLDAFPKVPFHGQISKIGKLSYRKDKNDLSKVFDIVILVEESDPILKPGMTVRCDIRLSDFDNVFYLENECIYKENGSYYVMISKHGRPQRLPVKAGPRNNQFTVIAGNFRKGQLTIPASASETE